MRVETLIRISAWPIIIRMPKHKPITSLLLLFVFERGFEYSTQLLFGNTSCNEKLCFNTPTMLLNHNGDVYYVYQPFWGEKEKMTILGQHVRVECPSTQYI